MALLDHCVYRQWFLEVFLGPFSNVNDRSMPMSDAVTSESPKTTGTQQSLCNLTLRNVAFKVFTMFLRTLSQIGEPLPILLLRDSASLRHPFYS